MRWALTPRHFGSGLLTTIPSPEPSARGQRAAVTARPKWAAKTKGPVSADAVTALISSLVSSPCSFPAARAPQSSARPRGRGTNSPKSSEVAPNLHSPSSSAKTPPYISPQRAPTALSVAAAAVGATPALQPLCLCWRCGLTRDGKEWGKAPYVNYQQVIRGFRAPIAARRGAARSVSTLEWV